MGVAAKDDPFVQGYLLAVAEIMHTHGEEVVAEDVLRTIAVNRRAIHPDMNEYDAKVLRKLFRQIEDRDRRSRAPLPPEPVQP